MGMEDLDKAYGVSKNDKFNALDKVYDILESEPSEELSTLDKAAQIPRGLATSTGGIADIIAAGSVPYAGRAPGEALGLMLSGKSPEEIESVRARHDPNMSLSSDFAKEYDKLYGKNLTPADTAGEIRQGVGEFLNPILGGYRTVAKGAQALGKPVLSAIGKHFLKKELPTAIGSSAAIHGTGNLTEEGGMGRAVEDIGKAIIGGTLGRSAATPVESLKSLGQGIKKAPSKAAAKIMSLGTNPEKEVIALAEKHGIELPHNIGTGKGMGSSIQNFLANNYLSKSPFSSGKYKQVYQKADEALMGKLKEALGEVGETELKPHEASSQFKHHAKIQETKNKKTADKLYSDSRRLLTEQDKIVPMHTQEAFKELNKILDTPIRGADNKEVTRILSELGGNWGLFKPSELKKMANKQHSVEDLHKIMNKFEDAFTKGALKEVPAEQLVKAVQGINAIVGSKDTTGVKNLLKGLRGAITKDLETSTNKPFLDANKLANEFYKENVGKAYRTKSARNVLRDEGAVDAYNLLNTPQGIQKLEKMAGANEQALENLKALKRLKAEEMLGKAVEGSIENGTIRKAAFSKIFEKGAKKQEVLQKLIGKKQYDNLAEIAKITESFSSHGKDLLNTSHTGITLHNLTQASAVTGTALQFIFGHVPPAQMMAAAGVVAVPQVMSRVMSNPNIIRQARVYALARQKGNDKFAAATMKNLVKMIEKEQKPILQTLAKQKTKEGDENE